jgi:transketolase C-terminal domain/subunit
MPDGWPPWRAPAPRRNQRQVSRYHQRTTAMLAAEKHRLVKVLGDAVSDLHGVAARALIDYLLAGGTPEQALGHAERQ